MIRLVSWSFAALFAVPLWAEPRLSRFQQEYSAAWQSADKALSDGDYRSAAVQYVRAAELLRSEPYSHLQAARCLAKLGDREEAIAHLHKAVEFGCETLGADLQSDDFASVAADPRIAALAGASDAARRQGNAHFIGNDIDQPAPLLVVLHGLGGNARSELPFWRDAGEALNMAVVAVRAPTHLAGSSYTWSRPGARHATDLDPNRVRAAVDSAITAMADLRRIDRQRIVLAGTSQGAFVAMRLLQDEPSKFRGVVAAIPVYEPIRWDLAGADPAVVIICGALDKHAPAARLAREHLAAANVRVRFSEFEDMGHEPPADFVEQYTRALRFVLNGEQRPRKR